MTIGARRALKVVASPVPDFGRRSVNYDTESLRATAGLARRLLRAETPSDACRAAVRFLSRRFSTPIAGWYAGSGHVTLNVVAVNGLESAADRRVRRMLPHLPRWDRLSSARRRSIRETFAGIVGTKEARAINAGDAILLVGDDGDERGAQLQLLGSFLRDVLEYVTTVQIAKRRNDQLDEGLAVTAHELRGPINSARMVMDRLLVGGDVESSRELASWAQWQLDQLSGQVDQLLQWSVGGRPANLAPTDLVGVVRQAVNDCSIESEEDRIVLVAPSRVPILADEAHMRIAVANLVRNALAYSPGKVRVEVVRTDGVARISVRDWGPGIPAPESETIFDPFVRGMAGGRGSAGGLGLFIAKRITEAHGGTILLESDRNGSTFHIEMSAAC
jgi:signal transduction histidine kinase